MSSDKQQETSGTYNQTQQLVEHRNGLGDDPRNRPGTQADSDPCTRSQEGLLVHVVRTVAAEDSNVDILARNVAENNTGNNDLSKIRHIPEPTLRRQITHRWDGKTVGNLLHHRSSGRQSRGCDSRAGIAVDDHGSHDVHSSIDNLQHSEGLGEIGGILHLRHDTEERDVGNEGEDDVGDGQETFLEGRGRDDIVLNIIGGLDTDGNHRDDGSYQDTDGGYDGHPENLLCCTRESGKTADDQTDNSEDNGAGTVVRDGVEQHGEGENVTGHQEDDEQQLADEENLTSDGAEKKLAGITHAVYLRETLLELAHGVSSVPGDAGQKHNDDKCPKRWSAFFPASPRQIFSYGTIPRVATADGRDRIPSEMFSATITR